MKTREQAEQRANELFPKVEGNDYLWTSRMVVEKEIKAFLQCWDEMQRDKQTCGFCVEPATELTNEKHSENLDTKENEGSELPSEKH